MLCVHNVQKLILSKHRKKYWLQKYKGKKKPELFVIQKDLLLTFRVVSLYIRFKASTSLKEENSKIISPLGCKTKYHICLLSHFHFDVTNSCSKKCGWLRDLSKRRPFCKLIKYCNTTQRNFNQTSCNYIAF